MLFVFVKKKGFSKYFVSFNFGPLQMVERKIALLDPFIFVYHVQNLDFRE